MRDINVVYIGAYGSQSRAYIDIVGPLDIELMYPCHTEGSIQTWRRQYQS